MLWRGLLANTSLQRTPRQQLGKESGQLKRPTEASGDLLSTAPRRDEPIPPRSKLSVNGQRLVSDFTLAYQTEGAFPSDEVDENIEITREICERARHQRQVFAILAVGFSFGFTACSLHNSKRIFAGPLGAVLWHISNN